MGIGTSKGAYYEDEFHYRQSQWDPKYDENEITPNQMQTDKDLDKSELDPSTGLGIEVADKYTTALSPQEEEIYKSRYGDDADRDYDMRGYYKANPNVLPNQEGVHYTDVYKKPNHMTFSDQSQYSSPETQGGRWSNNSDGSYTFSPSKYNLTQHSKEELQDYFSKYESGNKLDLSNDQ